MATFEEQPRDAPGEDTQESLDLPKVLEDADKPKEGKLSTSKSKGKTGEQPAQATEGAQASPEEIPPTHNLVQVRIPPRPQQRFPPETPPRPLPRPQARKR